MDAEERARLKERLFGAKELQNIPGGERGARAMVAFIYHHARSLPLDVRDLPVALTIVHRTIGAPPDDQWAEGICLDCGQVMPCRTLDSAYVFIFNQIAKGA